MTFEIMNSTGLRLWFYTPRSSSGPTVDRLVAQADGPFCHCEIQFSDGFACTLYMGAPAVLRKRAFSSPNYTVTPCRAPHAGSMPRRPRRRWRSPSHLSAW
jgi:hypothetical protein